jgi:hypothetical protein
MGDRDELRIGQRPEVCDDLGQRVGKIFIFAASEPMTFHHNATAEQVVTAVQRSDYFALFDGKDMLEYGISLSIQIV